MPYVLNPFTGELNIALRGSSKIRRAKFLIPFIYNKLFLFNTGTDFDPDALAYCQASGATDFQAINYFVKGIKQLGLWSSMVCWPLRSSQNAGTGSTAYSLGGLGTYNGTLINGPTWGADGVSFGGNTQRIEYSPQFAVDFTEGGYSVHAVWSGLGISIADFEGPFVLFGWTGSSTNGIQNVITTGVGGGTTWLSQSRNYNGNRYFQNFTDSLPISGNVGYGWNADTLTLQANGVDLPMSNNPSVVATNGNYPLNTAGRNNTTATATSRVSYLMAISPNVGMTSASMTALYNLAKSTLGQGLGLP
jgi:hypothetical protein